MFQTNFLILLLGHFIGDFYFQNSKMATDKFKETISFILHIALYSLAIILVFIPVWNSRFIMPIALIAISHALIDVAKVVLKKARKFSSSTTKDTFVFLMDQILHVFCIVFVSVYMTKEDIPIITNVTTNWLTHLNIDYLFVVKFLILLLGNVRPCNILIKTTVQHYKPKEDEATNQNQSNGVGAGATIGTLERFLITIFFVNNQYSLIGLILTAKSIARFSKLSDDKNFAEYYLMGTLLSVLFVIGLCIITL